MPVKSKGKSWSQDELVLVCNLYFSIPFGQMHARNPKVIAMAGILGRTPGSIAMKLVNFASLDPALQARGISGLRGVTQADRRVWEEFHSNWSVLATASEKLLSELISAQPAQARKLDLALPVFIPSPTHPTDTIATVRVRTMQTFFRKVVLAAYECRCCVTGNPVPELLIASHILPWSQFPEQRLNPQNGLCLAAHFDRAFDQGLITFGNNMELLLSSELRAYLPEKTLEREFLSVEGAPLRAPERFQPDKGFLDFHRRKIFRS